MGPSIVFDKSFLQALSVDESVWLDKFFTTIVTPVFLVEALADLSKSGLRRSPSAEVSLLANKTPELGGVAHIAHSELAIQELRGGHVEMLGRPILGGFQKVQLEGKKGVIRRGGREEEALGRWLRRDFLDVERSFAARWRKSLGELDLSEYISAFTAGSSSRTIRFATLAESKKAAESVVQGLSPAAAIRLLGFLVDIPADSCASAYSRWWMAGFAPLQQYAPYCYFLLTVEVFFWLSLSSDLISADRPSNRIDVAYLFYAPFCNIFVSSDKLHKRMVPLFLRSDQRYVDGANLKAALAEIDGHFSALPMDVRERGVFSFASVPPETCGLLVRELWRHFLAPSALDGPRQTADNTPQNRERDAQLLREFRKWDSAKAPGQDVEFASDDADLLSIQRLVRVRKGKWYQVPKDTPPDEDEPR